MPVRWDRPRIPLFPEKVPSLKKDWVVSESQNHVSSLQTRRETRLRIARNFPIGP